jgi:hypothetical protein
MSSVVRSRIAGEIDVLALVGSSLLPGLLMQSTLDCWPRWSPRTGSDSACQAVDASDIRWVVPVPGPTGIAITSRHSRGSVKHGATRRWLTVALRIGLSLLGGERDRVSACWSAAVRERLERTVQG